MGQKESRSILLLSLMVALRSRPNYIIVGEIRVKKARWHSRAMQTGHAVLATFMHHRSKNFSAPYG